MCSDLSEQAKEYVSVEWALVSLVHDDGAVVVQVGLAQRLSQQDTVSHVLHHRLLRCAVLKPNGIANLEDDRSHGRLGAKPMIMVL